MKMQKLTFINESKPIEEEDEDNLDEGYIEFNLFKHT